MPILAALELAFSLWMLVDAIRRDAPGYWWLVVMMPFGEWAYFFAVKIHDFRPAAGRLLQRPVSLQTLEYQARRTPSLENKTRLAGALHDRGKYARAAALFAEVLEAAPADKDARYGYALCCRNLDRPDESRAALEQLVDADFAFATWRPSYDLAHAYWRAGRHDDAVALLRRVVKATTLIEPRVRLARYLIDRGRRDEAMTLVHDGLEDHAHSPRFVQRRDRAWARAARRLRRSQ